MLARLLGPCVDHEILRPSVGRNVRLCAGHEILGPCVGQSVRAMC